MLGGISFRIWFPFALILGIITLAFYFYYPQQQRNFYLENKSNELQELAKTVALGIELSLEKENLSGVLKVVDFAADRDDFSFVAIMLVGDDGKETVFTSRPAEFNKNDILNRNTSKYVYQQSNFNVAKADFKGYVLIAASREEMDNEILAINTPIYVSTIIVFFLSFIAYILIARQITKPLKKLVLVTRAIHNKGKMEIPSKLTNTRHELGLLGKEISILQNNLLIERAKNIELQEGLEDLVLERTNELKATQDSLIASQKVASIGNFICYLDTYECQLPPLFYEMMDLDYQETDVFQHLLDVCFDDDLDKLRSLFYNQASEAKEFASEIRLVNRHNQVFWIIISGVLTNDHEGRISEIRGLVQDITTRKENELEIEKLSLVAKNTSNCVILTDATRRIVWVNKSALDLTGYSMDELKGKSPKMFQCEKTDPETILYMQQQFEKNEPVKCEILNRGKHGNEYWLELNIFPLIDNHDKVYGYMAVETNITELKNKSIELEQRGEELSNILDNAAEMIHTLDCDGNVVWANRSWLETLGVDDLNAKTISIQQFLHNDTLIEFIEVMDRIVKGESVFDLSCKFITTENKVIHLKGSTIPLYKNGVFNGSQAYLHNVTHLVEANAELEAIGKLQDLIMETSFDFLHINPISAEEVVQKALNRLLKALKAKIIHSTMYGDPESFLNNNLRLEDDGLVVVAENSNLIHNESVTANEHLLRLPFQRQNKVVGELVIALEDKLYDQQVDLLNLFANMLVSVEDRHLAIKQIMAAKSQIENINKTLEQKVIEQTNQNVSLSKTLSEQEKLVTIGEISAGIAHDLNTPLGTIKVGVENISYAASRIQELTLDLTDLQRKFLIQYAENLELIQVNSDVALRNRGKEMLAQWQAQHPHLQLTQKSVEKLIECGVHELDEPLINNVLVHQNNDVFVSALHTQLILKAMIGSVDIAVSRAAQVVSNVKTFVRSDVSAPSVMAQVDLAENINVVLGVFRHEFAKNVQLEVNLAPNLEIIGFDVRLFQLWSNIIKNAIDAVESKPVKKITVQSYVQNNKVCVSIANNGEMIPTEIREKIFDKFYSTKREKNGTGLGLAIVMSVLNEHNAKISLTSDENLTNFTIIFPSTE